MTRSILTGLLGLISVAAVASIPLACQSGGVGDPCTPEDEYNPQFSGFKLTEENIESRSFQCQTRICLVNHFQGRTSCPLGQPAPEFCDGSQKGQTRDSDGAKCVEAATIAPECDPDSADHGKATCAAYGGICDKKGKFCQCGAVNPPGVPSEFKCDANTHQFKTYAWHKPNNCQTADGGDKNKGRDCCIPGTDTPVIQPVCGQCGEKSPRDAEDSVYCSCRCGVADGEEDDPNFNFCTCPDGFECSEIRRNVGISDPQLAGKYCIKTGSKWNEQESSCGTVDGYFAQGCKGTQGSL
jgi:hypothetical protein